MEKQRDITEQTPDEIARYTDSLKKLFEEHKVDLEGNKTFFDALIEWKRTL